MTNYFNPTGFNMQSSTAMGIDKNFLVDNNFNPNGPKFRKGLSRDSVQLSNSEKSKRNTIFASIGLIVAGLGLALITKGKFKKGFKKAATETVEKGAGNAAKKGAGKAAKKGAEKTAKKTAEKAAKKGAEKTAKKAVTIADKPAEVLLKKGKKVALEYNTNGTIKKATTLNKAGKAVQIKNYAADGKFLELQRLKPSRNGDKIMEVIKHNTVSNGTNKGKIKEIIHLDRAGKQISKSRFEYKDGAFEAIQQVTEQTAKKAAKEGVQETAEQTGKKVSKRAARKAAKKAAKEGAQETTEQTAKKVAKEGAQETSQQTAETAAKKGAKKTAEQAAETASTPIAKTTDDAVKEIIDVSDQYKAKGYSSVKADSLTGKPVELIKKDGTIIELKYNDDGSIIESIIDKGDYTGKNSITLKAYDENQRAFLIKEYLNDGSNVVGEKTTEKGYHRILGKVAQVNKEEVKILEDGTKELVNKSDKVYKYYRDGDLGDAIEIISDGVNKPETIKTAAFYDSRDNLSRVVNLSDKTDKKDFVKRIDRNRKGVVKKTTTINTDGVTTQTYKRSILGKVKNVDKTFEPHPIAVNAADNSGKVVEETTKITGFFQRLFGKA